jgi:drug/metabolite transporter (DMT)-like permease
LSVLVAILSLLIAISGWYYAFYSPAARRLASIEDEPLNQKRVRLRQFGGGVMMALAVCFFAGFYSIDFRLQPRAFVTLWMTVCALLALIVWLALIDLRLTLQLRKRRRRQQGR